VDPLRPLSAAVRLSSGQQVRTGHCWIASTTCQPDYRTRLVRSVTSLTCVLRQAPVRLKGFLLRRFACTRSSSQSRMNSEQVAQKDANRPIFHVVPATGWINDPNGPCVYNGSTHMCDPLSQPQGVRAQVLRCTFASTQTARFT
jgi:hypothetical protein